MAEKKLFVVDVAIPFLKGVLEPYGDVRYLPGKDIGKAAVQDASALLVRTRTRCDASLLAGSSVRFVGTATAGMDHLDVPFLESSKIAWANVPGCNSASVAQYVTSALLHLSARAHLPLEGKTLGIIGVGQVGSKVQACAEALGMRCLLCDPPRARAEGKRNFWYAMDMLPHCDVVTLHVPLIAQGPGMTLRLANGEFIQNMQPHAWLINASRGPVLDNSALRIALSAGSIGGAVLDVWEGEPDIDLGLLNTVNFATAHIAGYSQDGKANATTGIVRSLARALGIRELENFTAAPDGALQPIVVDAQNKSVQDAVAEAYAQTYDIAEDDALLRGTPGAFEVLRAHYAPRREPCAYTVELRHGNPFLAGRLSALGFKVNA